MSGMTELNLTDVQLCGESISSISSSGDDSGGGGNEEKTTDMGTLADLQSQQGSSSPSLKISRQQDPVSFHNPRPSQT